MIRAEIWIPGVALLLGAAILPPSAAAGQNGREAAPVSAFCPASFTQFLQTYAESEDVQRKATVFPLPVQTLNKDAQPEPKPVVRRVRATEASYPLLPPSESRSRDGLELKIEKQTPRIAEVVLFKPDTDYRVVYHFSRTQCWRLQRIENWSL